jgi:nitrile hydratase accessory protein
LRRPDARASAATRHEEIARAADAVAPIPRGEDGAPTFREPWEAQAFAMTLALHERGLFTWSEWANALAAEIRRARAEGDPDDGSTYYRHWLRAVERLVAEKGVASAPALAERRAAWERAAHATPHGEPILLENDPLRDRGGSEGGQ